MRVLNKRNQSLNHLTADSKRKSGRYLTRGRRAHRNHRQCHEFLLISEEELQKEWQKEKSQSEFKRGRM